MNLSSRYNVEYFGTEMPVFKCYQIIVNVNTYRFVIQSVPAVLYKLSNTISTVVIYLNKNKTLYVVDSISN